jgi:cysteine desulfurase/selenocysteine lyase
MHPELQLDPHLVYLNHAAVSPWPRRSAAAVQRFAEENATSGSRHYPAWLQVEQRLRERMARLIKAPGAEHIALTKNTSEALSFVAQGLPWQAGDNIVSIAQEFPSNRIPWEALAARGVELRLLDLYRSADPEADLLALCDRATRLLSVSAVQYARGLRMDLGRIGSGCHRRGILFCVDAIQHIGALPFDVQAIQADFVAADGHKWMLGPEGLALFYVRPDVRERLSLTQFGWHMVEQMGDYDRVDWEPAHTARRFECGSPNLLGIHALEASLSLIEETGMVTIAEAIDRNVAYIAESVHRRGYELLSDPAPARRSGILTFRVPDTDTTRLQRRLAELGLVCAARGGGIRFSPHFYNGPAEIDRAFERVADALRA